MRRILRTVFLAAITMQAAGGPAYCTARKAVAIAVYVSGDVKIKRPGTEAYSPLKAGDDLYLEDCVETGPGSKASFALIYGAELRLNENSELRFVPGRGRGLVSLDAGQVWTRILHKKAMLDVRTPAAVCSIRGTETDIEQRRRLTVKVYEGHVDIKNGAGAVSLKAGEITRVVGANKPPGRPVKMGEGDAGSWQEGVTSPEILEQLERLEKRARELKLNIGKKGKTGRDVKIRLKKKAGG